MKYKQIEPSTTAPWLLLHEYKNGSKLGYLLT